MNVIVEPISLALFHFVWQGAVIAAGLAVALRVVPRAASELRYGLGVAALGLMLAMPVMTLSAAMATGPAPRTSMAASLVAEASSPSSQADVVQPPPLEATTGAAGRRGVAARALRTDLFRRSVVAAWFAGVLILTAIHTGGWLQLRRLRRSAQPLMDAAWRRGIGRLCDRLDVRRAVAVCTSSAVDVPTVLGWMRPVILIPVSALLGMNPRSLEALLAHELAHVRRHDYLVNVLQAGVETLLFYHPAVWWVSRRVRFEREHCCDDLAVQVCGSSQVYVQALSEMETLRLARPRMAVAADGGSLVERIRRLTGSSKFPKHRNAPWAVGAGALLIATAAIAVQLPSAAPARAVQAGSEATLASTPAAATLATDRGAGRRANAADSGEALVGEWRARTGRDHVWMELRFEDRWQTSQHSFSIDPSELVGTGDDRMPGFLLVRDAGSFYFEGELDGGERSSQFEFRADPAYVTRMADIGFDVPESARRLYSFAALDVSLDFAEGIRDVGYGDISSDRLMEFRIHGVSPEFVRGMAEAGYGDLPPNRLVEFRIHGVTPEFARNMTDAGIEDLASNRLVEFRIHGVTPDFVRDLRAAGVDELSASRLVEFRIHGVDAEFVEELTELDLNDLSPSRLVEFRIHRVTADFVRRARARYGDDLTSREILEMRIHGRGADPDH